MWRSFSKSIVLQEFPNGNHCAMICEASKNESLNSLIFMLILMFCTLEVMLFKTMIALDWAGDEDQFQYSYY